MKTIRKLAAVAVLAVVAGTSIAVIAAGTAAAQGGPGGGGGGTGGGGGGGGGRVATLTVIDNCGGTFDLKGAAGSLTIGITEPTVDPTESWSLQATQQEYGATTGARVGAPIDLVPNAMPQLAFSALENGFTTSATVADTPDASHGFTYTATRTSPSPLTCCGVAYWTDHAGVGPDPLNPAAKPDTAPAPTGNDKAAAGSNVVSLEFDQEMLATPQGTPGLNRLGVTVDGVFTDVTAVAVTNDDPPNKPLVSLTLAGDPLPAGAIVTVRYRQPLLTSAPQLQDLGSLEVPSFGPVTVPVA